MFSIFLKTGNVTYIPEDTRTFTFDKNILLSHQRMWVLIVLGLVSLCLEHTISFSEYKKIKDLPGDSIYVRALFNRDAENEDELSFKKDDILYVDNTLYNGILGVWRAWLIADDGNKSECGTIPSKSR